MKRTILQIADACCRSHGVGGLSPGQRLTKALRILPLTLSMSLLGCSMASQETGTTLANGKDSVGLAIVKARGATNDYHIQLATSALKRELGERDVGLASDNPMALAPSEAADIAAIVATTADQELAALMIVDLEVSHQIKAVRKSGLGFIPHVGVGVGPVGLGTSVVLPRDKNESKKLFYCVNVGVDLFDGESGNLLYSTRAFDQKQTEDPKALIDHLMATLAKRVCRTLEARRLPAG